MKFLKFGLFLTISLLCFSFTNPAGTSTAKVESKEVVNVVDSEASTATVETGEVAMEVMDFALGTKKIRYKGCACNGSVSVTIGGGGTGGVSASGCRGNKLVCRRNGGALCGAGTLVGYCDCSSCERQR